MLEGLRQPTVPLLCSQTGSRQCSVAGSASPAIHL